MRQKVRAVVYYPIGQSVMLGEAMTQIDNWIRRGERVVVISANGASGDRNSEPAPKPVVVCLRRDRRWPPWDWNFVSATGEEIRPYPLFLEVDQGLKQCLVVPKAELKIKRRQHAKQGVG